MFAYWRQLYAEEDKIFWVLQGKLAVRWLFQKLMCTMDESHLQFLYLIQLQADHSLGRRKAYFILHLICCSTLLKHTFLVEDLFVLCIWRHFLLLLHIILQALCVGWLYLKHHRCMRAEAKGSGRTEHPCLQLRPLSLTTPRPQPKETTSGLRDAHILHLQHICQATSERYVSCWLCLLH